jgi:hypothetical protein
MIHFWLEWPRGLRYHGEAYTIGVLSTNAVAIGLGWLLLWFARRADTFLATLVAHTWIVGWLVWQAFPWLGELI